MRRKCERRRGSVNADGAGAEVFVGDGCSQGASFGPMAAISRRWRGGRIYNNTRTREPLRRKCVKPADLTTHSPPKTFARPRSPDAPFPSTSARPRTATRPSRTLPLPPTQRQCTPADLTTHSPPKICSRPRTATRPAPALLPYPRSPDAHPQAAQCIPRRPHNTFPVEDLLPPPHSDAHCPSTFAPPRSADARPPTSQPIPRRRPSPAPAAPPCLPLRSASGTKKRHRTVDVRCRMSRSTVVAVGHWGW